MVINSSGVTTIFGKIDMDKLDQTSTNVISDSVTVPKIIHFESEIDSLATMQSPTYNINYSSLNVSELGKCDILEKDVYPSYAGTLLVDETSEERTSDVYNIFYISNFMGTSPGPLMSNKLFITSSLSASSGNTLDFTKSTVSGGARKRLSKMSLKELRSHAKTVGIKGRSKMDQNELIRAIKTIEKSKSKSKTRAHKKKVPIVV